MHATQLADIANWAAFNANKLVFGPTELTTASCNEYWSQSKCRQNRWMTALKMFEQDIQTKDRNHDPWPAIEIVAQEIFLTEILTRVWSAALVAFDTHHNSNEVSAVAHSIHIGHVEARNRAMRLLLEDESVNPEIFDRLNSLRRKVERWTDLLLGQLPDLDAAMLFAFQSNRVKDFRDENLDYQADEFQARRVIYSVAMPEDFAQVTGRYAANPAINRKIASGLVACFASECFDSFGLPKSLHMLWLEKTTNETQMLMEDLAALDENAVFGSCDVVERKRH